MVRSSTLGAGSGVGATYTFSGVETGVAVDSMAGVGVGDGAIAIGSGVPEFAADDDRNNSVTTPKTPIAPMVKTARAAGTSHQNFREDGCGL